MKPDQQVAEFENKRQASQSGLDSFIDSCSSESPIDREILQFYLSWIVDLERDISNKVYRGKRTEYLSDAFPGREISLRWTNR